MISERGHPTPLGFRLWEVSIINRLKPILEQYDRDHPAPVAPPPPPPPPSEDSQPDDGAGFASDRGQIVSEIRGAVDSVDEMPEDEDDGFAPNRFATDENSGADWSNDSDFGRRAA